MKLYSTQEPQAALRALCVSASGPARRLSPPSVSALWLESALAPAAAPSAFSAVTGGVVALGGAFVPGGGGVQGGTAVTPGVKVSIDMDVLGGTPVLTGTTEHVRTVEQIAAVDPALLLDRRGVQVQGTSGLYANDKQDMTAPKPNGGVRGAPPRGRPV